MDINRLNPYVRRAQKGEMRQIPDGTLGLDYQIIICDGGSFSLLYGNDYYLIAERDIIFLRPGIIRGISGSFTGRTVNFDVCFEDDSPRCYVCSKRISEINDTDRAFVRTDIFPDALSPIVRITDTAKRKAVSSLVDDIISLFAVKGGAYEVLAKADILKILGIILPENFPEYMRIYAGKNEFDVSRVKKYIDDNTFTEISLDLLSDTFGYSKFHILREFEASYGVTPIKYLGQRRMLLAAEKLLEKPIEEVSSEMGYSSVYSFSNAFAAVHGVTPEQYLKKAAESRE